MRVSAKHVLIAANPTSGAGSSREKVLQLQSSLARLGLDVQVIHKLDELRARALELENREHLRAVVSAGGDGTVAALANLLPAEVPLLIFPLGTENLMAKHLGLDDSIDKATECIARPHVMELDVGQANGKLFLVVLSCGFDADVVRRMHYIRSGHINRWSYTRPILSAMWNYRFPQLKPQFDGAGEPGGAPEAASKAAWLFVFNVPRYAAGLEFCPQADPSDGLLDVCMFRQPGIIRGFSYLSHLWFGRHQSLPSFGYRRCQHLVIEAPMDHDGKPLDIPFQIDGDPGGSLPLDIRVLPARLRLLTSQTRVLP